MDDNFKSYLKNVGIDIEHGGRPFADEYLQIKRSNNELVIHCFEHLLLTLILDLEKIKEYNPNDYLEYLKRINATTDSFWGQRNEIYWYSSLIFRLKSKVQNLRRGEEGKEADFLFTYDNQEISIEATSVRYGLNSKTKKPITKIKSAIGEKEDKPYKSLNCCVIIDFTNLSLYRKLQENFTTTISDLIANLNSDFGAILFCENFHIGDENPKYETQTYTWINPMANPSLRKFLGDNLGEPQPNRPNKVFFKVG